MLAAVDETDEIYVLSAEERAWLAPRLEAAERREFASDQKVAATFAKFGA